MVRMDEEGFLYFVGRNDEMIKTSGYRVSPTEIEEVVYGTGLVGDAVAFGVEDPQIGQHIVLAVSPANGALDTDQLLAELKQQLPLYMLPKRVEVRASLPRSPNNKFDRNSDSTGADCRHERSDQPPSLPRRPVCAVGDVPLDRLAERVGSTPFFAYDRRRLTERVELLRAALPADIHLSYAVKANPMPAVVQHLSRLVDGFDVASAAEMRTALDTPMPAEHGQLRRAREDGARADSGGRRRRHDRDGVRDRGAARGRDR